MGNLNKLEDAGLISKELPEPHRAVVEDLSDDEMNVLLDVGQRLGRADTAAVDVEDSFTSYIAF